VIKTSHLSKKYRKKIAVDDLSFEVETGKVTGFLGPNGAGKSTTMRLMLGLDNGRGKTVYDDKPLHEYSQPSKVVGILLEAKAFHPTRSARNHLKILATAGNIPLKRVDEVLDIVGLKDVDEPANGLDPEGIAWLRDFLKNYADEGNAVFVSSHLLSEMSLMADNIIVIGKGKLIADTSISKLLASSKSSVFVRTSNLPTLERSLKSAKIEYRKEDKGLLVSSAKTDDIGKLAHSAKVTVLELTARTASLEQVFLELTEGSEEYQGKAQRGKK
jgi:ABC-2 type transport system ATP-binding protein